MKTKRILNFIFTMVLFLSVFTINKKNIFAATESNSITYLSKNLDNQEISEYKVSSKLTRGLSVTEVPGYCGNMVLPETSGITPYQLVGDDNRRPVSNPESDPYAHVCYITYTYANGTSVSATGWLAGPDILVTSGHCVYDGGKGGWIKSMRVYPGYTKGKTAPFGSANATTMHVSTAWIENGGTKNDFAIVQLDRKIGNSAGYFGYGYGYSLVNKTVRVTGYPGNKKGIMKTSTGKVISEKTNYFIHAVDTTGGQSGSPMYKGSIVYGIHSRPYNKNNAASRITKERFDWLNTFR